MFVGEDQITCLLLGTDVKMKPFNIDDFTTLCCLRTTIRHRACKTLT